MAEKDPLSGRSPDPLLVREQGVGVRSLHQRGLTWVVTEPLADHASRIAFKIRQLGSFGLISGTLQGVRHEHTSRPAGDLNDDFSLHLNLSGRSFVSGRDREVILSDGDAVLLSYAEARRIARPGRVRYAIVRMPRATLAPLIPGIDDAVMKLIPQGTGLLRLLTRYIGHVVDDPVLERPDMQRLVALQLSDLIAATVGATREGSQTPDAQGLGAVRLKAIKQDIEAHLGDDDLSPSVVAARQGISDSYLRKLFERDGITFSEFVLDRRLALAYRMLVNPHHADRAIAAIAFATGFGDLSYFNRTFRRRYGATPTHVRNEATDP
jgi:AraC-like DNA-binding protein